MPLRQTTVSSVRVFDLFTSLASVLLSFAFSTCIGVLSLSRNRFAFLFSLRLHVRVDPCRKRERGNEIYEDMEWVPRLEDLLRKFYENWMDESAHCVSVPFFTPTLLHLFSAPRAI